MHIMWADRYQSPTTTRETFVQLRRRRENVAKGLPCMCYDVTAIHATPAGAGLARVTEYDNAFSLRNILDPLRIPCFFYDSANFYV